MKEVHPDELTSLLSTTSFKKSADVKVTPLIKLLLLTDSHCLDRGIFQPLGKLAKYF